MRKGTTIPLPGDRAYNTKLDTVLEEDKKKKKDNDNTKLKNNIFNISTALEKCINLTATVKKGEDGLYF